MAPPPKKRDPFDGDYIGNIFGWKISIIGAVVIGAICLYIGYNFIVNGMPDSFADPLEGQEERYAPGSSVPAPDTLADTLKINPNPYPIEE